MKSMWAKFCLVTDITKLPTVQDDKTPSANRCVKNKTINSLRCMVENLKYKVGISSI